LERAFERKIRGAIIISDIQIEFMSGKSTIDVIFTVRQLVEKYGTAGKNLFVAFIDLEKAFDCVPREVIWWALRKKGVIEPEVRAVMEMYQEAETAMQIEGKKEGWQLLRKHFVLIVMQTKCDVIIRCDNDMDQ